MKGLTKTIIAGAVALAAVFIPITAYAAEAESGRECIRSEIVSRFDRDLLADMHSQIKDFDFEGFLAERFPEANRPGIRFEFRTFDREALEERLPDRDRLMECRHSLDREGLREARQNFDRERLEGMRERIMVFDLEDFLAEQFPDKEFPVFEFGIIDRATLKERLPSREEWSEQRQSFDREQLRTLLEEATDALKAGEIREFITAILPDNLPDLREMFTYRKPLLQAE